MAKTPIMKTNAYNPIRKTKIEESMIKKPVFVTLLKTEELLVLITKRYPLITNFQSYFNFCSSN